MQTSRFKGVFSKRRRYSSNEKSEGNTRVGPHELFRRTDQLGEPSLVLPSRPSTSVPQPSFLQTSKVHNAEKYPEEHFSPSKISRSKPHKSFSGLGDAIEEFRSYPTRTLSRRRKGLFPISRSAGEECGRASHKHSDLCPANAVHYVPMTAPWYCYNDEDFTALPVFPGSEISQAKHDEVPVLSTSPDKLLSGAAARAAAAAQNEILDALRNMRLTEQKVTRDSESGVGIEVRTGEGCAFNFDIPVVRKGKNNA